MRDMSLQGTDAYRDDDPTLPALVVRAVAAARAHGFAFSCRPEQGRLLHLLAAGASQGIAETGTGCGVGLAWLASAFRDHPQVEILHGDWRRVEEHGPYDLLVLRSTELRLSTDLAVIVGTRMQGLQAPAWR